MSENHAMDLASSPAFTLLNRSTRTFVQVSRDAIVMVDDEQNIVGLNQQALRTFGLSKQSEVLGSPLSRLIPQICRDGHARLVEAFIHSNETERRVSERGPIHGLRADGSEFPAEATVSRVDVLISGVSRRFYFAFLHDCSHEEELESELAILQLRVRSILDLAPVAMWIVEGNIIVYANPPAAALFGLDSPSELLGQSIYDLLHTDSHKDLREQHLLALDGSDEIPRVHGVILRPDGKWREVELGSAALPDHGSMFVQMVLLDITDRRAEGLALERSKTELRELSASVVDAREEERRHIARELHDELGQRLTALKMELSGLPALTSAEVVAERVGEMLEMVDETVAAVRRIATDLRPLMLDDLGLNSAIEWLARDAARRMDLEVTVYLGCGHPELDDRTNIAIYRMAQEALTNAARHAMATDVRIELKNHEGHLLLTIQDNGVGFPKDALERIGKYGLMGIRERALMLGGRMEIDNPLGGGGRLSVHLPMHKKGETPLSTYHRRKDDA